MHVEVSHDEIALDLPWPSWLQGTYNIRVASIIRNSGRFQVIVAI